AHCGHVRAAAPNPGEPDDANRRRVNESSPSAWGWCRHRGKTSVHDDARGGKAEFSDENVVLAWCLQRRCSNALRVSVAAERLTVGGLCQTPRIKMPPRKDGLQLSVRGSPRQQTVGILRVTAFVL